MCCSGGVCGIYGTCKLCGGGRNSSVTYGPTPPPLITLGAPGLLPLSLNSGGTRCCMHLWQTVGHLATNGFFITSRGCQLGELVARRCRYVCGAATVSVVGRQLCPCHLCMCGGWRGRVVEQLARALPPPAFLCQTPHNTRGTPKQMIY